MSYRLALVEFLDEDFRTHVEIEQDASQFLQTLCTKRTSAYWATVYKTERSYVTCLECSQVLLSAFTTTPSLTNRATDERDRDNERYYSADRAVARCSRTKSSSSDPDTPT